MFCHKNYWQKSKNTLMESLFIFREFLIIRKTGERQELQDRNEQIYMDYVAGEHMEYLAEKYFLSVKSIQRIIGQLKREHND